MNDKKKTDNTIGRTNENRIVIDIVVPQNSVKTSSQFQTVVVYMTKM